MLRDHSGEKLRDGDLKASHFFFYSLFPQRFLTKLIPLPSSQELHAPP